ncbi:hypothetical protein FB45DRAFT_297152 [Roridomyces roridus]|uniref:Uncharacterized protein n=1 Tax=Roridomyces roridus TaxID=1738132 RepID=A0AAD7CBT0_9AGAR|nr:hypothetical protein FB45DRAFT_297152 [Roridomyces roridus]
MATNINNIVTGLDYDQMKQQVPEPFFTEYAKFFCIPVVDQRGQRRPHVDLTHEIILQGGIAESEPRVVPVLDNHDARYIDGILHFHRRTPKEMRDAAGLKSLERGVVDFPVQRFEELEDLDMDEEERAKRVKVKGKGKKREREAAAAQGTRPMMEFMFPPVGRRVAAPTEGEVEREPVPEDYLGEMVADLKNEAKAAKQELAAAQAALQSAVYNYEALQVEIEQERAEWGKLLDYVKSVAGQEVVNEVLRRADGRARGRIFEDEIPEVVATEYVLFFRFCQH